MAFTDETYYVGEIQIPNLDTNYGSNDTALTQAIDQYEKEILIDALGYALYKELQDDIVNGVPQTQKFIDLVNGKEYELTCGGITTTVKWNGLVNAEKQSLLSYYVFYKFMERNNTQLAGVGTALFQAENAERVNPSVKLEEVYYRMLELYGRIPYEIINNRCYWSWSFYYYNRYPVWEKPTTIYQLDSSLYNFLASNTDTYTNWLFKPKEAVNRFGI